MKKQSFITKSEDETIEVGYKFSNNLKPMDVVLLRGDLGSGKTTFTKGLAKGLGISKRIISPTFVLVRTYHADSNSLQFKNLGIERMYHLDLYRLLNISDVLNTDVQDYLSQNDAITVIEWPEIGAELFKRKVWNVYLEDLGSDNRKIEIFYE